jgi:hypothetical protein
VTTPTTVGIDEAATRAEEEPNAERIETYTRDFVIDVLYKRLEGLEFEHFIAELLSAMGYRRQVTQASGDGGFDIIAHRDPLGLEPPTRCNAHAPSLQSARPSCSRSPAPWRRTAGSSAYLSRSGSTRRTHSISAAPARTYASTAPTWSSLPSRNY